MTRRSSSVQLITADAICDANLSVTNDGKSQAALLIEHNEHSLRVLDVGLESVLSSHPSAHDAIRIERPGCVVLPALVNAHTHLDLTHIGARPYDPNDGFVSWVDMVRTHRHNEAQPIADAVRQGCHLLRKGGVAIVGDIAGAPNGHPSLTPFETLAQAGLHGVSYLEFFAIGTRTQASVERVRQLVGSMTSTRQVGVRLGIQPHAPNTVAPDAYLDACELATRLDLPLITHLAESVEEREFVANGTGPQHELLERLGIWDEASARQFGKGLSPVQHLAAILAGFNMNAVHVNQCSDDDLNMLALTNTGVVYCPRASAYFGAEHHFGAHRYREMIERGITVALGTDSVINIPEHDLNETGLSPLAEARLLYARDACDPGILLRMMTTHGASILREPESRVLLSKDATPAGVIAVEAPGSGDPMARVMSASSAPQWLLGN